MSKMGAMPLFLVIILARTNAYSRASVMLRVSGTILHEPLNRQVS